MTEQLNLQLAERKAWTLYFQDGLWDIFLGLLFLGGGLRSLTDSLWAYLLILGGLLAFILGKRAITLPRLGLIHFGRQRQVKRAVLIAIIMATVAFTFLILLLPLFGVQIPGLAVGLIFAVIVPGIFVIMAYLMDFPRLYLYAAFMALFMLLNELVSVQVGAIVQCASGIIALAVGLILLRRFLHNYPTPQETANGPEGSLDRSK